MAINPNISLAVQPPPVQDPMESAGRMMGLKQLAQQGRALDRAETLQLRDIADEDAVRKLLSTNPNATLTEVATAGGMSRAKQWFDALSAQQKADLEKKSGEVKLARDRAARITQILQGVQDDVGFQRARGVLAQEFGAEVAQGLGDNYNPQTVQQAIAEGMEAKEFLDMLDTKADNKREDAKAARDAEAHAAELPRKRAEARQEALAVGAQILQAAKNQADWDAGLAAIDDESVRKLFGTKFTPGAVSAAQQRGMSAEQWLATQQRDAQLAEQARHNRAAEAQARAVLSATNPDEQSMTQVAEMVLGNPELLDKFNPTQRGRILTHIAQAGGGLANKRQESVARMIEAAEGTLTSLGIDAEGAFTAPKGFSGAVGAGFQKAIPFVDGPLPGTRARDYTSLIETLRSQLTLPQLEYMRGLGAMSEREFKTVGDSVTALSPDLSEAQFKIELEKIAKALRDAKSKASAPVTRAPSGNPFRKQ